MIIKSHQGHLIGSDVPDHESLEHGKQPKTVLTDEGLQALARETGDKVFDIIAVRPCVDPRISRVSYRDAQGTPQCVHIEGGNYTKTVIPL